MSKPQILLVEDDPDIREAIRDVLESDGYKVLEASNGVEGLTALEALGAQPCLIVLDLMMPVLDGVGFLEQLTRAHGGRLPHQVLVASADRAGREKVAPFGVSAVLTKPFDLTAFLSKVESLCAVGGSPAASP